MKEKSEIFKLAEAICHDPYTLTPDQWQSEARQALKIETATPPQPKQEATHAPEPQFAAVECSSCDWHGTENDIPEGLGGVENLWDRIDSGSEVPVGECPECGCLAYLVDNPYDKPVPNQLIVEVSGGCVVGVYHKREIPGLRVIVVDMDPTAVGERASVVDQASADIKTASKEVRKALKGGAA